MDVIRKKGPACAKESSAAAFLHERRIIFGKMIAFFSLAVAYIYIFRWRLQFWSSWLTHNGRFCVEFFAVRALFLVLLCCCLTFLKLSIIYTPVSCERDSVFVCVIVYACALPSRR